MHNKKGTYWVKTVVDFCPVCCSESTYRIRMPKPKPESFAERYITEERYDWCDAL